MAKQPKAQQDGDTDLTNQSEKRLATAKICVHVMAALGRPRDFLRVTACQVTGDGYRVNVVTGPDAASSRIAHSFFVTADANGNVTTSAPAIMKQY